MSAETLGVLDRSFVAIERPGLPMHVGGLAILDPAGRPEGPIRPSELRRRLSARLRDLPRMRARLGQTPLGLRGPVWVPDEGFDVGRHLEHWTLPAGSDRGALLQFVGVLHARLLPRDRPLWRVALIDGLRDGRQALLTTTHHSITDGIAGVEVTRAIFDRPARTSAASPGDRGFLGAADGPNALTRALQAVAGAARYVAGGPISLPGPFNGRVGPGRAIATADLRLEDAVAIKRGLGGSVDDVVLASVALGLGAHLERAGWRTRGTRLRTLVPISTLGGGSGLGNHVTAMFLDLPVDLPPARCLHEIVAAKAMHRTWHEPLGLLVALRAAALAPSVLASPLTVLVSALPFANLIVSDVPGPPEALSLLGAPMVAGYPLMPLTASVGLSIAVITVAGAMGVGVTADPALVPDPDGLAAAIAEAFARLQRAAEPDRRRRLPQPRQPMGSEGPGRPPLAPAAPGVQADAGGEEHGHLVTDGADAARYGSGIAPSGMAGGGRGGSTGGRGRRHGRAAHGAGGGPAGDPAAPGPAGGGDEPGVRAGRRAGRGRAGHDADRPRRGGAAADGR